MRTFRPAHRPVASAFTLLEVLVASAVLSVVMMVMLSVLTTSLSLWRNTEGKALADREARATQLLLAQDLANVVIPASPELWPNTNRDTFQFLVSKPADYRPDESGDIFFVQYWFDREAGRLQRAVLDSDATYRDILVPGAFPTSESVDDGTNSTPGVVVDLEPQLVATHLLSRHSDAVRGLALARNNEVNETNFVILNTNLLPMIGQRGPDNFPAAVEINFAVADPDTLRNVAQLENPNFKLRNAGLYSSRFFFPRPPPEP